MCGPCANVLRFRPSFPKEAQKAFWVMVDILEERGAWQTNVLIRVYHRKTIKKNKYSLDAMQNAIMAIWHHSKSTDDSSNYDLCPEGELRGLVSREMISVTADYTLKDPLSKAEANAILPIFEPWVRKVFYQNVYVVVPEIKKKWSLDWFGSMHGSSRL